MEIEKNVNIRIDKDERKILLDAAVIVDKIAEQFKGIEEYKLLGIDYYYDERYLFSFKEVKITTGFLTAIADVDELLIKNRSLEGNEDGQ